MIYDINTKSKESLSSLKLGFQTKCIDLIFDMIGALHNAAAYRNGKFWIRYAFLLHPLVKTASDIYEQLHLTNDTCWLQKLIMHTSCRNGKGNWWLTNLMFNVDIHIREIVVLPYL